MSNEQTKRYVFSDFRDGIVTELPEHAIAATAVPHMKNIIVDDDGTLLALPWNVEINDAPGTQVGKLHQVSFAPSYDDNGNEYDRCWLTRYDNTTMFNYIETPGATTPWRRTTGVVGGSYDGLSNVIHYAGKTYWAAHQQGVGFDLFQTEAGTPAQVVRTTPTTVTQQYRAGAKFPLYMTVYRDHIWAAGDADPNGSMRSDLHVSAAGDPASVSSSGSAGWGRTILRVGYSRGDAVTGLRSNGDALFVFKTHSITRIDGTPSQYSKNDIVTGIGCIAPNSLQTYGDAFYFLSQDGFVRMTAGGAYQFISAPIQSRVRGAIATLPMAPLGHTEELQGMGLIHNNRYWFLWPNGELWAYDLVRKVWSFFDAPMDGTVSTNASQIYSKIGFAVLPYAGRWPSTLCVTQVAQVAFRSMARTDNFVFALRPDASQRATYYPPMFETKASDLGTQDHKQIHTVRIVCEIGAVADDGDPNNLESLCMVLIDESNQEFGRAYLQAATGIGDKQEFVLRVPDHRPVRLCKIRLFSAVPETFDHRQASEISYLRIHQIAVDFRTRSGYIQDASQDAVHHLDQPLPERWQDDFDGAAIDRAWSTFSPRFGNITQNNGAWSNDAAGYFGTVLMAPGVDAYRIYELAFSLQDNSRGDRVALSMTAAPDQTEVAIGRAGLDVQPHTPLSIVIGRDATFGLLELNTFTLGSHGNIEQHTQAATWGSTLAQRSELRLRLTHVPQTGTFLVEVIGHVSGVPTYGPLRQFLPIPHIAATAVPLFPSVEGERATDSSTGPIITNFRMLPRRAS